MMDNKSDYNKKIYSIDNWQKMHVQHLSYTRNLFILLASAGLGYTLSQLNTTLDNCIYPFCFKCISLLYLLSITCGAIIAYQESENYRLKYNISRNIEKSKEYNNLEEQCTKIENRNKRIFEYQLILFVIGIMSETLLLIFK